MSRFFKRNEILWDNERQRMLYGWGDAAIESHSVDVTSFGSSAKTFAPGAPPEISVKWSSGMGTPGGMSMPEFVNSHDRLMVKLPGHTSWVDLTDATITDVIMDTGFPARDDALAKYTITFYGSQAPTQIPDAPAASAPGPAPTRRLIRKGKSVLDKD